MCVLPPASCRSARPRAVVVLLIVCAIAWGLVASPSRAAYPGQNGHFALVSNIAGPDLDIYGYRPSPLFHVMTYSSDATFSDSEMQYSPDGERIVFSSNRDGATTEIYTMNTDGTGLTRITTNAVHDAQPAFSADGTKIAFTRVLSATNWDIFVKNADGTGAETNLTNTPSAFDGYAAWAPNDSKIAFATSRVGNQFDIWTMNTNGTAPAVVLALASQELYPDYSPDSTRIVAQTNFGGNANIFTMTTSGTGIVALTSNGASDAIPFYSPDGTKVGFTSNRAGNNNLYTVNASGPAETGLQQWTTNAANEIGFDWQPVFPADLAASKSDTPDPAPIGSNVTYTLRLEHQGGGDATGVYLVDTLPDNVVFVSASAGCVHNATTGIVLCTTDYIRAGEVRTFDVTVQTTETGSITNRVQVIAGQSDPDPADNTWDEGTTVRPLQADLSVSKTASPESVVEGQEVTYTVTSANAGPEDAPNVVVVDTLPATVDFVSASPGCTEVDGTVTCAAGNLAVGGQSTFEIVVDTTTDGTITNAVSVTSDREDPNPVNNTFTLDTVVTSLMSDLSISKSDTPDPIGVGDGLTYTLQVNNAGPDDATGVVVTDTLPGTVTFVSATAGCTHLAGTVTCGVSSLPVGDGATFEIVVRPTVEGVITNTATVTSDMGDLDTGNNSDSEQTTVSRIATRLETSPLVLDVMPITSVDVRVGRAEARLTRADTGAPIAGELVAFRAGSTELCRAITAQDGFARCTARLAAWLAAAVGTYDAVYAGSSRYLGSIDRGPVVRVVGVIEVR